MLAPTLSLPMHRAAGKIAPAALSCPCLIDRLSAGTACDCAVDIQTGAQASRESRWCMNRPPVVFRPDVDDRGIVLQGPIVTGRTGARRARPPFP